MNDILRYFNLSMGLKEKSRIFYVVVFLAVICAITGFLNTPLAVGLFLLLFLAVATLFFMHKARIKDANFYLVFLIALAVHLAAVLFIYYSGFGFGGGSDFTGYHQNAVDVSYRIKEGNFSLDGLGLLNYYPVLIALIYTVTLPEVIIGNLFTAWLSALSVMLAYLMVLEIGGTKKTAFAAAFIVAVYPSYLYFGSVLLKDTVVIPLVLVGMLLIIRILKNFFWPVFLVFFIILTALIHLRFYVGYALMLTLIISWPLLSQYNIKKRMAYWLAMVLLLGFSPFILGSGYYGSYHFKKFLNPDKITYFREIVYATNSPLNSQPVASPQPPVPQPTSPQPTSPQSPIIQPSAPQPESPKKALEGSGSTFIVAVGLKDGPIIFLKNSFQSFTYSLLGPFPWQFNSKRQVVGLAETIPWYLLIITFFYHAVRFIKKNSFFEFLKFYRFGFPLLLFSVLALGALSLFINNYGIIARIRIPMFICLVSLMCIMFNETIEKLWSKKS